MITVVGNLWDVPAHIRLVTTNGVVTKDGHLVMGRGTALQATQRFPGIQYEAGEAVRANGNIVQLLRPDFGLFPVKEHWRDKASLSLIRRSVEQLCLLAGTRHLLTFALPFPGIGNGGLAKADVVPLLTPLPDNVLLVILDAPGARKAGW